MSKSKDAKPKPGPEPERLRLEEEDWEEAVGKALKKERPPEGWPKGDEHDSGDEGGK